MTPEERIEKRRQYARLYRAKHPDRMRKATMKYLESHREISRKRSCAWRLVNPEKMKAACRNWYGRTRNKITVCLYSRLCQTLNNTIDRKSMWQPLGYTYEEFAAHMETKFANGMTWDNHGKWEIDHIIPISFFVYDSPKDVEFKMCWRLENIRPMWKHEHRCKGMKVLVA